ncbi:hypothetical protein ACSBR2_012906 [Camellia fascicularis]
MWDLLREDKTHSRSHPCGTHMRDPFIELVTKSGSSYVRPTQVGLALGPIYMVGPTQVGPTCCVLSVTHFVHLAFLMYANVRAYKRALVFPRETFSLTPDSLDFVDLQEGSDENVDVSNLCLVGKILALKNLNKTAVSNIIQGAWKTRAKLAISSWSNNIFLFQFIDPEDRRRVLMETLWSVMGYLLVL